MGNTLNNYFGSKRSNLSDKSNDGDKRKNAEEDSFDLSLNQDDADVSFEAIASPIYASTLCDYLKNLD